MTTTKQSRSTTHNTTKIDKNKISKTTGQSTAGIHPQGTSASRSTPTNIVLHFSDGWHARTFFSLANAAFSFFSHFLALRCICLLTIRRLTISSSSETLFPIFVCCLGWLLGSSCVESSFVFSCFWSKSKLVLSFDPSRSSMVNQKLPRMCDYGLVVIRSGFFLRSIVILVRLKSEVKSSNCQCRFCFVSWSCVDRDKKGPSLFAFASFSHTVNLEARLTKILGIGIYNGYYKIWTRFRLPANNNTQQRTTFTVTGRPQQ